MEKINKPEKRKDAALWRRIVELIENGKYIFVTHAQARLIERNVSDMEVLDILENKRNRKRKRNKIKDSYTAGYLDWNYCVEGLDLDGGKIRIIISLADDAMLIITVIRLSRSE